MNDFLTFVAGAAIGGLLSWLITHRYYVKSGVGQKAELAKLQAALKPRNTLSDFEDLLRACDPHGEAVWHGVDHGA